MRRIKQRSLSDCGIACLAMLADRTYDEAKAFMVKNFPDARLTSSGKIVAGLRHFGIEPLATRCRSMNGKSIDQLECDAAVMVSHRRGQSRGDHWIVWDSKRRRILDPLEEGKRVYPFKYLQVRS